MLLILFVISGDFTSQTDRQALTILLLEQAGTHGKSLLMTVSHHIPLGLPAHNTDPNPQVCEVLVLPSIVSHCWKLAFVLEEVGVCYSHQIVPADTFFNDSH